MFKLFKKIIEIIFPNSCISCNEIISLDGLLCAKCFAKVKFICAPKCQICSYPFEIEIKHLPPFCGKCLDKKPYYDKALAIYQYNEIIAKSISALKYSDQTFLAKKFAQILFKNFKDEIENCDIICAVPLHKKRLRQRKFNQSALIAKFLDHKKFNPDLLWRLVNTLSQVKLKREEREQNLKKAFLVNKKYRNFIKDKTVLLIDDVATTGATINNCARALKKSGAKKVVVLTIAKTVFDH